MFIALVLFVALYGVFSTAIVRQLDDERFKYRENFVWAVFQVQRQFLVVQRDIEAALGRVGLTDEAVDEVLLEYEILVSRVYLLRDGDGFEILLRCRKLLKQSNSWKSRSTRSMLRLR